ncbi:MAG: Abi family protein [Flavobacterium sp.]|uniref:Abi family protein n=1 Tax=Flavobacterium sp. TaxID=239 RepID=UPI0022C0B06A|nr:Abi family protein [Flavobacterium sp.]MCZ8298169.1 Abi family protein [Flavobacterium sp.]
MHYDQFETLMSAPRLARYWLSCKASTSQTQQLYKANIRLSQSFLGVLSIFEVVLRNRIDQCYKTIFFVQNGADDWLVSAIHNGGFLTQKGCEKSLVKIRAAYNKLGKHYTHDKLVAELSFGVWVFLFAGKQYQAGGNILLSIFPKRPRKLNQKVIYQKLNQINSLRNRVAHHEPICFGPTNTISANYARLHFQHIVDLLTWMDVDATALFEDIFSCTNEMDALERFA